MEQQSKTVILLIVAIAMIMERLDATVLNTALPQIALSLHTNPIELKVAITAYLLAVGVFIPVSGWMSDRIGERSTLMMAMGVFVLGSIGCALSVNLTMLVLCRLLQGMGGAFLAPVARLMMVKTYHKGDIVKAMTTVAIISNGALTLGPLVGGAVTTFLSWRWIFFLNVPLGFIGFYGVYRYFLRPDVVKKIPFDWLGFIFMGIILGLLLFLLDILVQPVFSWLEKGCVAVIVIMGIVIYRRHLKKATYPIIHFEVFKNRTFALATLGSLSFRLVMSTVPFLIPLMLQATYGYSAFQSGLFLVPMMIGALLCRPFIKKMLRYFGYRQLLLMNSAICLLVYWSYAINAWHFMPVLLVVQLMMFGCAMGVQFTSMNTLAYKHLKPELHSQGVTILSAVIQLSGSFGVALAALVMVLVIGYHHLSHHIPQVAFQVVFLTQGVLLFVTWFAFYCVKESKE